MFGATAPPQLESTPFHPRSPYAVSKAALDKLVEAWRVEHPAIGFTRMVVGDCAGGDGDATTQFADGWDPELATELVTTWATRGYIAGSLLDADQLVDAVDSVLRQTVRDLEVFIIGDGVHDVTREAARALEKTDPRVRFFDHPKHARRGEPCRGSCVPTDVPA